MAHQVKEDNIKVVKAVHYSVIFGVFALIVTFICIFYYGIQPLPPKESNYYTTDSNQAPAKPFPDFIVDKLEPNELEQLKP